MTIYEPKTRPFSHQRDEFASRGTMRSKGLLWEQGTGKTKQTTDEIAGAYEGGEIDSAIVVAPNGVHQNWIDDEYPIHLPDRIAGDARSLTYHSKRAGQVAFGAQVEALREHRDGFATLAISYDGLMTPKGRKLVEWWLKHRRPAMVLDESTRIKSPSAKRTHAIVAMGRRAKWKRILTGTPVPNGPFDIYAQMKFLDEDFWRDRGFGSFESFKTHFGVFKNIETKRIAQTGRNKGRPITFESCVGYKHLGELQVMLQSMTSRVTKEEVLDLPAKIYSPKSYDLSPEQRRVYESLRDEFVAWLDGDEVMTAPMALTRMTRFRQICAGFYQPDEADAPKVFKENPKLDLLEEIAQDLPHQAIIWGSFRHEIDSIIERLDRLGLTHVRYDGAVPVGDERQRAKEKFNRGDAQFFVANPAAAGMGLTLIGAKTTIYSSNSFDLDHRLQSEDRNHRIGQDVAVNYIDLIGRATIEVKLVQALRDKIKVAAAITGDDPREWL